MFINKKYSVLGKREMDLNLQGIFLRVKIMKINYVPDEISKDCKPTNILIISKLDI